MPTPKITLRIKDGGPARVFRFYGKRNRDYHFLRDDKTHTHVFACTLEEWRANDHAIARDIFGQPSHVTIVPDVIDLPVESGIDPKEHKTLKSRIKKLEKQFSEATKKLKENDLLIKASGKRIDELLKAQKDVMSKKSAKKGKESPVGEPTGGKSASD